MHSLFDPTPGQEHTANKFNHTDETGNYRLNVVDGAIKADRWDAASESYVEVAVSEKQHAYWMGMMDLIKQTGTNHLPSSAKAEHKHLCKALAALRKEHTPTVKSQQDRIAELEAENARLKSDK